MRTLLSFLLSLFLIATAFGAIAFANSSAIIYSHAGRPAHAESARVIEHWSIEYSSVEYWPIEYGPWVAVANAHATFIARCSGQGGREWRAAQAFVS